MTCRTYNRHSPVARCLFIFFRTREWRNLADAPDLGSGGETHGGSSPPSRTNTIFAWDILRQRLSNRTETARAVVLANHRCGEAHVRGASSPVKNQPPNRRFGAPCRWEDRSRWRLAGAAWCSPAYYADGTRILAVAQGEPEPSRMCGDDCRVQRFGDMKPNHMFTPYRGKFVAQKNLGLAGQSAGRKTPGGKS